MRKDINVLITDSHLNCFGDFDISDKICQNHCILSLRCIIEKNQNSRMEIFEELMAADMIQVRSQ